MWPLAGSCRAENLDKTVIHPRNSSVVAFCPYEGTVNSIDGITDIPALALLQKASK